MIDRKGAYLQIVWDVKEDKRAWVNMDEISRLMPPNWPTSNLDWYEASGQTKSAVAFFEFSRQAPKIYRDPSLWSACQGLKDVWQGQRGVRREIFAWSDLRFFSISPPRFRHR